MRQQETGIWFVTIMAALAAVAVRPWRLFTVHNLWLVAGLAVYTVRPVARPVIGALETFLASNWGKRFLVVWLTVALCVYGATIWGFHLNWAFMVWQVVVGLVGAMLFLWRVELMQEVRK